MNLRAYLQIQFKKRRRYFARYVYWIKRTMVWNLVWNPQITTSACTESLFDLPPADRLVQCLSDSTGKTCKLGAAGRIPCRNTSPLSSIILDPLTNHQRTWTWGMGAFCQTKQFPTPSELKESPSPLWWKWSRGCQLVVVATSRLKLDKN